MSLPGPSTAAWGLELLLFALAVAVIGEAIRSVGSRHATLLRITDPWERALLDLYLGGGTVYAASWIPGLFGALTVPVLALIAAIVLVYAAAVSPRSARRAAGSRIGRGRWPDGIVAVTVLGVFVVELIVLGGVPSGNTWDASALTLYGALLQGHHALGLSAAPLASGFTTYPQGSVVWITAAQLFGNLSPARSALLLSPLFLALSPVGAYVVARQWLGTPTAGACFAVVVGVLGTWTRLLVSGSYDFAFAFPLVLLLAGWSVRWVRGSPARWTDVVVFGALLGYSAALNPVGAEWIALAVPIGAALTPPRFGGVARAWAAKWLVALGAAIVFVVPNIVAIGFAVTTAGPTGLGVPPVHPASWGVLGAQFVGGVDPYLFRAHDIFLSPFPVLRVELAVLLTVTAVWPWLPAWRRHLPPGWPEFGRWLVASGVSATALVAIGLAGAAGNPYGGFFSALTSSGEATVLLFTLFTFAAAVPAVVVAARLAPAALSQSPRAGDDPIRGTSPARGARRPAPAAWIAAIAVAAALVAPGVAVFPTSFPTAVRELSQPFGNLTLADFDLLAWASSHLPAGSRVLVAPGGALQFLPGYAPSVVVVFSMLPGQGANASYRLVVAELSNATLDGAGLGALATLHVGYVGVTQANTVLWPPFVATPLLALPGNFSVAFHEGDAYLFART
ncbi:MAG: hypothetical protein L3K15_03580 [Thermoplasmata archaeon]|nr:hypothetical protein [Thermoplasmata archaeon]